MTDRRDPTGGFEPEWLERSLDRHYAWGLVFMVVLLVAFPLYRLREPDLRSNAEADRQAQYTDLGASLFASHCAQCHGENATGGTAPTLNSQQFLNATTDEQVALIVAGGVTGTSMSAWSIEFGGSLTDQQILQIVTFLRTLEPDAPSIPDWHRGAKAN